MRCRECEYPLWNIPPGPCPECGAAFRPSEFEFMPASVAFCCPECDQAYFGTAYNGHLIPRSFACRSCSARIDMDSMSVRPAADRPEALQMQGIAPCTRSDIGSFKKWWGTFAWSVGKPGQLMASVPVDRSLGLACRFVIPLMLLAGLGLAIPIILLSQNLLFGRAWNTLTPGTATKVVGLGLLVTLGTILVMLIGFALWAALAHLTLVVFGNRTHGYGRTLSSLLFASGPLLVFAFPCIGLYCAGPAVPIWMFVLMIIALRSGQELTVKMACRANFVPVGLLVLLGVGWLLLI